MQVRCPRGIVAGSSRVRSTRDGDRTDEEPGQRREKLQRADVIVDELVSAILRDLKPSQGAEVLLHVIGFGGTPLLELYMLQDRAEGQFTWLGFKPVRFLVGNYTTSLEMAVASRTVTMLDSELKSLWDAPVHTAILR